MASRKPKQRAAIQASCSFKLGSLDRANQLLNEMEIEHQRGTDWVPLDDQPAAAVGILTKLDMIQVIKFNDGEYYGQLKGAGL